jgi:hypothetical protein
MTREEKMGVLEDLTIGSRVAEDEVEQLASYFVETDQWRRVIGGQVDIVFGPKGGGKSAIYASLLDRTDEMFDRGITFVSGENPRGAPAFRDLVADPPTSEIEFVGLWKLYILALVAGVFEDFDLQGNDARLVLDSLQAAGLFSSRGRSLSAVVRAALDYVRKTLNPESVEGGVRVDAATGLPTGVTGKITFREPTSEARAIGVVSADDLLRAADAALSSSGIEVWILLDRLDVAFAESRELETNALRALFKVYLDLLGLHSLTLKIFLRSDIWRDITAAGFREASHLTRTLELDWNGASLLNLLVRRLLQNPSLVAFYAVDPEAVKRDAVAQREFFERLVPEQVDSGRNPRTFEWMLGRVKDGTNRVAPRELIHLMTATRDVQLAMLERGESEPAGENVFSRQAFRDALPEVSEVRLEQTLFAEYPDLKPRLQALEGQKTNQSLDSLAAIWQTSRDDALDTVARLVDIGFFERRGSAGEADYWVPFVYRPALKLVQGAADEPADLADGPTGKRGTP